MEERERKVYCSDGGKREKGFLMEERDRKV
jgi:hypothetical protein